MQHDGDEIQPTDEASASPPGETAPDSGGPAPEPASQQDAQPGAESPTGGSVQRWVGQPWQGQPSGYPPPGGSAPPGGYVPPGGYGTAGGYGPSGGYGTAGGYGPPGPYGPPADYIQQPPPPKHRRLTNLITYVAVAAIAAAAGAGTVALIDHQTSSHPQASRQPSGNNLNPFRFGNPGNGNRSGNGSAVSSGTAERITRQVAPALVIINSNLKYYGGSAAGTGMIISSSGLVLTNNHVINGTTGLSATVVGSGRTYSAKWLGYDKKDDVAVLRLQGASGLPTVPLGDSSTAKVGDGVVTLGNADGTGNISTATGSITGLNQNITASDNGSSANSEHLHGMIQTNADIVSGDSGGPMVSTSGKVIGMDTAAETGTFGQVSGQAIGFAIPINKAMNIAHQIIAKKASAKIQINSTGFLGVLVASGQAGDVASPSRQRQLELREEGVGIGYAVPSQGCVSDNQNSGIPAKIAPVRSGTLILGSLCGLAAANAGISGGDVITAVNGQQVTSPVSMEKVMEHVVPGSSISVSWVTVSGQHVTRDTTVTAAPPR